MREWLESDWRVQGRMKQQPPDGDWTYWWLRAGRGFGKTLTAAQWVKGRMEEEPGCRIALVAPTLGDGRDTMVEGETGLLSIMPESMLRGGARSSGWNRSLLELYCQNGSRCKIFGSDEPDRLRGPQHHYAWLEEISSWKDAARGDALETTWSNVKLGTRLGEHPRYVITSTPKPNKLTKALMAIQYPTMRLVTGSSYENRDNLSAAWWREVILPYEGTRLGRQEIYAEVLSDVEGALWSLSQIEQLRVDPLAPEAQLKRMRRILVAVDPNASSSEGSNSAGVIVVGLGENGHAYVLADLTTVKGGPRAWAAAAVDAYHEFRADKIIAESNNGGEMVKLTIRTVDNTVPVKLVNASRGKRTRAEPVAAMYEGDEERGNPPKVHHVGRFEELEEQMTTWTPEAESPDRMDALVWGLSELMLKPRRGGRAAAPTGRIPGVDPIPSF